MELVCMMAKPLNGPNSGHESIHKIALPGMLKATRLRKIKAIIDKDIIYITLTLYTCSYMPPKLAKNHLLSKTGLRHSSHEIA